PVSKSFGEPTRVLLLSGRMPIRTAIRSMMIYNLAQAMGTASAFTLGAALAPLVFDLSDTTFAVVVTATLASVLVNAGIVYWMLRAPGGRRLPSKGRNFRALLHWLRWISHQ